MSQFHPFPLAKASSDSPEARNRDGANATPPAPPLSQSSSGENLSSIAHVRNDVASPCETGRNDRIPHENLVPARFCPRRTRRLARRFVRGARELQDDLRPRPGAGNRL